MNPGFAATPEPPYWAVIFTSRRTPADDSGYAAAAERMMALAQSTAGCLGAESVRDAEGFGITVSYWRDEAAIATFKNLAEHILVQRAGRELWYERYELRVARVERAYGGGSTASR